MKAEYILVVEDEANVRETLVDILALSGHKVKQAENGEEAMTMIKKKTPVLIISDIMMPKMDGYELLKEVKSSRETELVPFILLTAKTEIESRLKGYTIGADDYITKPFEMEELSLKINNILNARLKLANKVLSEPEQPIVSSERDRFLKALKDVIESKIEDPKLDLEYIANQLGVSISSLQKKVKKYTGGNTSSFIREFRLRRAKQLIEAEYGNISQIAQKTGFSSLSYFSLTFKKYFGYPPTAK